MALWRTLGCMAALTFPLLGMTGCGDSEPEPVPPEVEASEDPVPALDVGLGTEEVEPAEVEPAPSEDAPESE